MINWFKRLFTKKDKLYCGGDVCCIVNDSKSHLVGKLWYRRPTYDERVSYLYEYQYEVGTGDQLRAIKADGKNKVKKFQEVLVNDLFLPYAEKIFIKSEGYFDEHGDDINCFKPKKQFEHIKKYYSDHFIEMVSIAFIEKSTVKKK